MIRIDQSNDGTPQAVYDDEGHRISLGALLAAHRDVLILKDYAERLQAEAERREREIARLRVRLVVSRRVMRALVQRVRQLENDARAPWLPQNSATGQQRLAQNATYATERREVAK
jgi:hypothetical protein